MLTDFKDTLVSVIDSSIDTQKEMFREEGKEYTSSPMAKALELSKTILETRFQNELRQYNFDEDKAYDEFIAKKNLEYLRFYIEECLMLDKSPAEKDYYLKVRKEMRNILQSLHFFLKEA